MASVLLTGYSDWDEGLYHDPTNCYRANGWKVLSQTVDPIQTGDSRSASVSVSRWEKQHGRVLVLYWYQLGDQTLFHTGDLKPLRAEMNGRRDRPLLVKVLLLIPESDRKDAAIAVKDLAGEIRRWLDDPHDGR
jgi:hypothetical protein